MADLQVTAAISDLNVPANSLSGAQALAVTQAGSNKRSLQDVLLVTTSDTAIPIPAGTLGYALFINLDPTNPIDIKTASSGTIIARLDAAAAAGLPGGVALLKIGSGITAPAALATTASCRMLYRIWEA